MKNTLLYLLLFLLTTPLAAQPYVDSTFAYTVATNIAYGQDVDFAGNVRQLQLDVAYPTNDAAATRPLVMIVHGGAFIAGTKSDAVPARLMRDFAARGYVAASINYRLGYFQTSSYWNCNVSLFGVPWNCLNARDTTEWYRAAYRGMQDLKGATRYMVQNATTYKIDPDNVFYIGESAGGFVTLAAGYLDHPSEKTFHYGALSNVTAPNNLYQGPCVQTFGLDTNIASMRLTRPDLGPIEGTLNTGPTYTLKGVGSIYGGMFQNLMKNTNCTNPPALYMFHQRDDLIVPYNRDRLFAGYTYCLTMFPANCAYILNRPFLYGSRGIRHQIDTLALNGYTVPDYQYDSTNSNRGCNQVNVPYVGHSLDNYVLRSRNLALYFAQQLSTGIGCSNRITQSTSPSSLQASIYPNPAQDRIQIQLVRVPSSLQVHLTDLTGKRLYSWQPSPGIAHTLQLPSSIANGTYLLQLITPEAATTSRINIIRQ